MLSFQSPRILIKEFMKVDRKIDLYKDRRTGILTIFSELPLKWFKTAANFIQHVDSGISRMSEKFTDPIT